MKQQGKDQPKRVVGFSAYVLLARQSFAVASALMERMHEKDGNVPSPLEYATVIGAAGFGIAAGTAQGNAMGIVGTVGILHIRGRVTWYRYQKDVEVKATAATTRLYGSLVFEKAQYRVVRVLALDSGRSLVAAQRNCRSHKMQVLNYQACSLMIWIFDPNPVLLGRVGIGQDHTLGRSVRYLQF